MASSQLNLHDAAFKRVGGGRITKDDDGTKFDTIFHLMEKKKGGWQKELGGPSKNRIPSFLEQNQVMGTPLARQQSPFEMPFDSFMGEAEKKDKGPLAVQKGGVLEKAPGRGQQPKKAMAVVYFACPQPPFVFWKTRCGPLALLIF